ncbi:MAG: hypothetical protein IPP71_20900 [Bacteroidetes bacterium]|nr:hypothetical protein [Bacteroidota bacterium]
MKTIKQKTVLLILFCICNSFCAFSQNPILWGMTSFGGSTGGGTIFKIYGNGTGFTLKHSFASPTGINPYSNFILASNGKMYATVCNWGANQKGTLISFDPLTNIFTDVHNFNFTNGGFPSGSLIQLANGIIYGLAQGGGINGNGVIFSFDPAINAYNVVHDFYWPDGDNPRGGLIQASNGILYGMTSVGGSSTNGNIFSFDPATNTFANLFSFIGSNGSSPIGDLIEATNGKLYGMTYNGGTINGGVLFSFDLSNNTYTKLIDFTGSNGKNPSGTLLQFSNGLLYGLTKYGGANNSGILFSYDISNSSFSSILNFIGTNGDRPCGSLSYASDGKMYGMTQYGGVNNKGTIFSFEPLINNQVVIFSFNTTNGEFPRKWIY